MQRPKTTHVRYVCCLLLLYYLCPYEHTHTISSRLQEQSLQLAQQQDVAQVRLRNWHCLGRVCHSTFQAPTQSRSEPWICDNCTWPSWRAAHLGGKIAAADGSRSQSCTHAFTHAIPNAIVWWAFAIAPAVIWYTHAIAAAIRCPNAFSHAIRHAYGLARRRWHGSGGWPIATALSLQTVSQNHSRRLTYVFPASRYWTFADISMNIKNPRERNLGECSWATNAAKFWRRRRAVFRPWTSSFGKVVAK